MKFKFFNAALLSLIMSISSFANATLISLDDWHLTTDGFAGLKQSSYNENVYFAVSKSNTISLTDTYEMIEGFHWASTSEAASLFGDFYSSTPSRMYYNQAGWNGYVFEGVFRFQFIFSDSAVTGHYKHAAYSDGSASVDGSSYLATDFRRAGLVLIKNTDVPEPSTLAIFALGVIGLASRRFKKQS
jgi:hypothetical protein